MTHCTHYGILRRSGPWDSKDPTEVPGFSRLPEGPEAKRAWRISLHDHHRNHQIHRKEGAPGGGRRGPEVDAKNMSQAAIAELRPGFSSTVRNYLKEDAGKTAPRSRYRGYSGSERWTSTAVGWMVGAGTEVNLGTTRPPL